MTDHQPANDEETTPKHRTGGSTTPRDGFLIIDDPAHPLSDAQRARLSTLRDSAARSGDVIVVAAEQSDPEADVTVPIDGADLFSAHAELAQQLRRLGVKRLLVAGSNQEKVAATCYAGRRAGFTMDLASLHATPSTDFMGDGDVELLPGDTGGAPLGAQATGPIDDGRTDAVHWDDTWALRGEASPADAGRAQEGGVRGWISKKLHDAQTRRPGQ